MRTTALTLLTAAAVVLAAVGASSAARKPTRAERVAISELTTQPARCIDIAVSTVDPSWATYYSRGLRTCPGADGYVVVRKIDGLWEYVTSNSGTDQGPCSAVRPVPPAVGGDLQICMLPRDCGTLRIEGYNLPVRITQGQMRCTTARRVVRTFFPRHGRGRQTFRVGGRRWFCANSHGSELERGGVAHCVSDWFRIMVYEPGT